MRRTPEAAARTRDEVLAAALFCFAESGWDGSTLDGIGQRAGLTRGAVHHHFGDKRSLLQAVLRESWASQSGPLLAPLLNDAVPPAQRLADFVAGYLIKLGSDPSLRALAIVTTLVAQHVRGPGEGMDDHRRALEAWREHIARVVDACPLRTEVTTSQVLFSLMALLTGATLEASTDPAHLPDPVAARVVATSAVRGWLVDQRCHPDENPGGPPARGNPRRTTAAKKSRSTTTTTTTRSQEMYDPRRGYPAVVPCILYDDLPQAVRWLSLVLGFREVVRASLPDGWTGHSELERDGFILLLGRRGGQFGESSSITQVYVDDVDLRCQQAASEEGRILDGPSDQPWGVRQAVVADPEGQRWVLTRHVRDTDPAEWFGTVLGPVPG